MTTAMFDGQLVQLETGAVAWAYGVNAMYASADSATNARLLNRVAKLFTNKYVQETASGLGLKVGESFPVKMLLRVEKNITIKRIYKGEIGKVDAIIKIYRTSDEEPGKSVVDAIRSNQAFPSYLLGSLKPAYRAAASRPEVGFSLTCRMERSLAEHLAAFLQADGNKVEVFADGDFTKPVLTLDSMSGARVNIPPAAAAKPIAADPHYFEWETQAKMVVDAVVNRYKGGYEGKMSLMFGGPSGYGKTTAAAKLAEKLGFALHIADMSLYTEPEDVFGLRQVVNGTTSFVPTKLAEAIAKGRCVVVLDEINRAFPMVLNGLFGILDDRNMNHVRGVDVVVGPQVVFIATRNLGNAFVGTMASDYALINRFQVFVDFGNLSAAQETRMLTKCLGMEEAQASKLVNLWTTVRQSVDGVFPSPRTSKAVWEGMKCGLSIRQAIQFSLIMGVSDVDTRRQLEDVTNRFFGTM